MLPFVENMVIVAHSYEAVEGLWKIRRFSTHISTHSTPRLQPTFALSTALLSSHDASLATAATVPFSISSRTASIV